MGLKPASEGFRGIGHAALTRLRNVGNEPARIVGRICLVGLLFVFAVTAIAWSWHDLLNHVHNTLHSTASPVRAVSLADDASDESSLDTDVHVSLWHFDLKALQESVSTGKHIVEADPMRSCFCFCLVFLLKQAFSIPGAGVLNALAGAMAPLVVAIPLCLFLTSFGAGFAYLLSWLLVDAEVLTRIFGQARVEQVRRKVLAAKAEGQLFYWLVAARVFPFTPHWALNALAPHAGIPLLTFCITILLGQIPYIWVTASAGSIISKLSSLQEVWGPETVLQLMVLTLVTLLPAILKKRVGAIERAINIGDSKGQSSSNV